MNLLNNRFMAKYILVFILYGILVTLVNNYINYRNLQEQVTSFIIEKANIEAEKISTRIAHHTNDIEDSLLAIKKNKNFQSYLENSSDKLNAINLLQNTIDAHKHYFQVRFIDDKGMEKIRLERSRTINKTFVVSEDELQNKAHRDYFIGAKNLKDGSFWYSDFNFNIEYHQFEIPLRPTYRIAMPVYYNNIFRGILIVNIDINHFLKYINHSQNFHICIGDENARILYDFAGNFLYEKNLDKNPKVYDLFPGLTKENYKNHINSLDGNYFIRPLPVKVSAKNELHIIMSPKVDFSTIIKSTLIEENKEISIYILIASFFVTLISIIPIIKMNEDLLTSKKKIIAYTKKLQKTALKDKLVDENVIFLEVDLKGTITDVSSAFCNASGFSKAELIGKNHLDVKHPKEDKTIYKEIWETIENNKIWKGEIKNLKKDGTPYWVNAIVSPVYEDGIKIGYKSVRQDITNKKLLEELSITDELTQIHNRRYFNQVCPKFINNAKRYGELVTFVVLDVDYFKFYNDNNGHQKGDEVLQKIASVLKNTLKRPNDFCFRLGGEEFGLLYTCNTKKGSIKFCNEIRQNIEKLKIEHKQNSASDFITASFGICIKRAKDIKNIDEMYKLADEALYKAKAAGRNNCFNMV